MRDNFVTGQGGGKEVGEKPDHTSSKNRSILSVTSFYGYNYDVRYFCVAPFATLQFTQKINAYPDA
jgi:hypothetical protein